MNNKQLILKNITKQLNNIIKQLNQLQKEEIDFSEWIGRWESRIAIKGDKYLISYADGDVLYTNKITRNFTDAITYKTDILANLQIGDVFIFKKDLNDIKIEKFKIFVARDSNNNYIFQHLSKNLGVEQITYFSIPWHKYEEVIVFNRN